jgi:hypothetical protein
VKTRSSSGAAKYPIGAKMQRARMIQRTPCEPIGVAHCRYGTTFSHSLGGLLPFISFSTSYPELSGCLPAMRKAGALGSCKKQTREC